MRRRAEPPQGQGLSEAGGDDRVDRGSEDRDERPGCEAGAHPAQGQGGPGRRGRLVRGRSVPRLRSRGVVGRDHGDRDSRERAAVAGGGAIASAGLRRIYPDRDATAAVSRRSGPVVGGDQGSCPSLRPAVGCPTCPCPIRFRSPAPSAVPKRSEKDRHGSGASAGASGRQARSPGERHRGRGWMRLTRRRTEPPPALGLRPSAASLDTSEGANLDSCASLPANPSPTSEEGLGPRPQPCAQVSSRQGDTPTEPQPSTLLEDPGQAGSRPLFTLNLSDPPAPPACTSTT